MGSITETRYIFGVVVTPKPFFEAGKAKLEPILQEGEIGKVRVTSSCGEVSSVHYITEFDGLWHIGEIVL